MNKSIGLLKSLMKKNLNSPMKKPKKQMFSINKLCQGNFNSNKEKKKNIYQKSLQRHEKNNKHKSIENNLDMNPFYRHNLLNGNSIPNTFKISQNNSKTINNSKNKNPNTSLQKKIGSKSYVDLFQNNMHNSNEYIKLGTGKTISNSIYDKIYDFENNNISYDYNNYVGEINNILNIFVNYINIIKKEYEKIIIKKIQNKDKEISKLKNEKEYLIKENKKLKFKIIELFYCIKKYVSNNDKNKEKYSFYVKRLINENKFLRKCIIKTNYINKSYYKELENDICDQIFQKELLIKKNSEEEEKNNKIIEDKEESQEKFENNPFKLNNNSNGVNNIINHKRQKTQFKLGPNNENNHKMNEEEKERTTLDVLSGYIKLINNNNMLMSKAKNSSQKNLLLNENNNSNDKNKEKIHEENKNNISNNENENSTLSNNLSTDSVIHNDNTKKENNTDTNIEKEDSSKKIMRLTYSSPDEKYIKRIEFTK